MKNFQQIDQWIEKQHNSKKHTVRLSIPDYPSFKLEISPKQRKAIRLYYHRDKKTTFVNIGIYPLCSFEKAFKKGIEMINRVERGENPTSTKPFIVVWDEFIRNYAPNVLMLKPNTIDKYKLRAKKYLLKSKIADKDVDKITLDDIKQIYTENEHKPGTNVKINHIICNLMRYSLKKRYIQVNPLENFRFSAHFAAPSRTTSGHYPKIVNPDDLKNLIETIANKKIMLKRKILVFFALETALRSSNLLNLVWEYVDFEKCLLKIPKTEMKGELRTQKSRQDFILPVSDTMIQLLFELQRISKAKTGLVFDGVSDQHINYLLKNVAGITKHGLRGTFKTFTMKLMRQHKLPNYIIELYMYHTPTLNEVEAAYADLRYDDLEIQDMLRELANFWDSYLLSLYDFRKIIE